MNKFTQDQANLIANRIGEAALRGLLPDDAAMMALAAIGHLMAYNSDSFDEVEYFNTMMLAMGRPQSTVVRENVKPYLDDLAKRREAGRKAKTRDTH